MSADAVSGHRGWWYPLMYKGKCHWADADGRALCGRWDSIGVPPVAFDARADSPAQPDDCAACRRKLDKLVSA